MSDVAGQTTQQLFNRWRSGDGEAGQAMAQRFSDWYYAISASRLGDRNCRPALERACQRFAQGVASVTDPSRLASWAHEIVVEEIRMAGGRVSGGDHPNALTGQRSPTELLTSARAHLTAQHAELLHLAYDPTASIDQVRSAADAAGGYPLAVLEARYSLKRALRDHDGIAFSEVPEKPNLDWGPLPLYEGGRMSEGKEEQAFEHWMLSDLTLCKDIAEFAAFALALRGGALGKPVKAKEPPRPEPVVPTPEPEPQAEVESKGSKLPLIIGGVVLVVVAAAVAAFLLMP